MSQAAPGIPTISRRSFLRRAASIAATSGLPLWFIEREIAAAAAPRRITISPNERPNIALIGCGGMGTAVARNSMRFGDIVAVCDVEPSHIDRALGQLKHGGRKIDTYSDFRKLLERNDIHAVINGTPDHWHSLINICAAKSGKDIYCEKPLTLTIDEGRHVIKAVRDNQAILQTGTQQRSASRFRLACELVRNQRIGNLKEVTVWLPAGVRGGPFKKAAVPAGFDWDYWQGQAPEADYVRERTHTTFRNWYEYSGGTMTDWGAHHMDIGYWAIGLPAPEKIEGRRLTEPVPGGYNAISDYEVSFTYPNGVVFHVKTTQDDSPFGAIVNAEGQRNGIRFEGTDGWIWVNRGELKASERELLTNPLPDDAERLYLSDDHMGNFIECLSSRKDPIADVVTGHLSSSVCHLGAIALRTQKILDWDFQSEAFIGDHAEEANTYLSREMRKPYDYDFVS